MNLTWKPSPSASSFYAVSRLLERRTFVDPLLSDAIRMPAQTLEQALAAHNIDGEPFFDCLIPLSAGIASNHDLARSVLTKAAGRQLSEAFASPLAGLLGDIERSFETALPNLSEALGLREQPIRQQWEARGPGLLHLLRRATEGDLVVAEAQVVLVHPVLGGGGLAHPAFNQVTFEAVLTDVVPGLPEVLRLAWLLAQLQLDLPRYTERLSRGRARRVGPLAMTPIALFAGEQVELCTCDAASVAGALHAWCPGEQTTAAQANLVFEWWQIYVESRPSFAAALLALDQMLGE